MRTPAIETPDADDAPEIWTVFDSAAKANARRHNATPEVEYELHAFKGTPMPRHHAAVFLKDPSFRVLDAKGNRIMPLPEIEAQANQARKLSLADGETVARFDELTDSALLARVASRPGGTDIAAHADREGLIAFLLRAPRAEELPRHLRARDTSTPEGGDPDAEELGDADARAMLMKGGSIGARDVLAMGG